MVDTMLSQALEVESCLGENSNGVLGKFISLKVKGQVELLSVDFD
jgi:hypothetical protein